LLENAAGAFFSPESIVGARKYVGSPTYKKLDFQIPHFIKKKSESGRFVEISS